MGYQIIKQPDGRLCLWSTYTDSIVATDATAEEVISFFIKRAAEDARRSAGRSAGRIVDLVLADRARETYYQFTMTYDEAVEQNREENR